MLPKEEFVEQAYLFKALGERMETGHTVQELLRFVREEVLATTKLPMAIDFLLSELNHAGKMSTAMHRLTHYFAPFQAFLIGESEKDTGRFDTVSAFSILEGEARLRSEEIGPVGLFFYQFEAVCRHHLRYDHGLVAMSNDPMYDDAWKKWILNSRTQIEAVGIADLVYVNSEYYLQQQQQHQHDEFEGPEHVLFGVREGRIALANRTKDASYLFAALQRQMGYPPVPQKKRRDETIDLVPKLLKRVDQLELRIKLMEDEGRSSGIDLSQFYDPKKMPKLDD